MRVKRFKYQSYLLLFFDKLSPLSRCALAVLMVSIAAIATHYIPIIGQRAAFLLFFFAIIQSSTWLGKNIGFFAMALSLPSVNIEVLLPLWHSEPLNALVLNAGFCVFSVLIIVTAGLQKQLALSVLKNEHDLRQAQAIGHVGSWRLDVQQNELVWSEENHRIFGIPNGTLMSYETFLGKVHPEDRDYVNRMWQAALSGQPYDIEHRIIVDDKIKWVRERAELEFASNGALLGGFGTTQNITDHKLHDLELQENRQRYVNIIESAMDAIITIDADQRILVFNTAAEKMFGINAAEAIGTSLERFVPNRHHAIHAKHIHAFGRTRISKRIMNSMGVVTGLRANGDEFPIEVAISNYGFNDTEFYTAIIRDISERKQADATLRESESRIRLATEATGVGIWEWHISSKRILWDAQMFRIYGINPTEDGFIEYNSWSNTVLPEDLRDIEETLENTDRLIAHRTREFRIRRASDQGIRYIQSVETTRTDNQGNIEWLVGTNLDVTELKRTTDALKASEAFIRDVLNSLPEHLAVLDEHGIVTAVNEPWECFALDNGASPHNVSVGANYLEVCRKSSLAGDPYARMALSGLETLINGSQEKFIMEYPCQTSISALWFLMTAIRMHQGSDGIILSHLDITERKQAETALHESETRLTLIMQEVKASCWDWDLESGAIYSSPEWKQQIGFDVDEPLSPWEEWEYRLHPADKAMVLMATKDCITGRKPTLEYRYRILHKNGLYRWIHSHGALMRNHEGNPNRVVGINLDITDYMNTKELNERREEMEKSTRLFIASQTAAAIAHELNQPLTAISYYAFVAQNMLKADNLNSYKLEQVLEKCGQQAQRAGDTIQQLLALLHKGETASEPIDINQLVNYAVDYVKTDEQSHAFIIKLNLTEDLPPVTSNALQIQKVLINLINNGLESIKESGRDAGTIAITTCPSSASSAFAQVSVRDCGSGASDKETLNKIFQPFYTTKSTGLGMGLAISRSLVEGHGGKMWAEQNSDMGLTIHFTLPFAS